MKWIFLGALLCTAINLSAKLNVVASNALIADWIQQVGGGQVEVVSLAVGDLHQFEPSPRQIGQLADADLVVAFGTGMEPWLARAMQASGSSAPVLRLNEGLDLLEVGEAYWRDRPLLIDDAESKPPCCKGDAVESNRQWAALIQSVPVATGHYHDHHEHHDHDHGHEAVDPHTWLDPQQVLLMVFALNAALNELDPAQAGYFDQRRIDYLDRLIALDEWAEARLADVPVNRRLLISYHDNLRYFGRRYGFITPASVLGSITTDAADPSAKSFQALIRLIQQYQTPVIFNDGLSRPLIDQLCREARVRQAAFRDYLAVDGPADYLAMMRANVEAVASLNQP